MNTSDFRTAAHAAVDEIADYLSTVQDRPVLSTVSPGYLQQRLPASPPQNPEPWAAIQRDIEAHIMPGLTHWQSPNFMAYFPTSVTYPGILGELYSAALSAPGFNWQCSPAMTELETVVLDWMAGVLHLPDCFTSRGSVGGGVIQGSASEAVATVMVAAREKAIRRACAGLEGAERDRAAGAVRNRLVAMASAQSHSCTQKAAIIAGVRFKALPTGMAEQLALGGDGFRHALEECEREGEEPFFCTVNIGATPTCAVDDIAAITSVNDAAERFPPLWIHVDAAYAGAALILEEYIHLTKPLNRVDSFDVNMHKWLLVNFDCSLLFVRNRRDLTDVLSVTPSYLRNRNSDSGLVIDYRDWQIPLGRRFRSLKIWFVIRTYGVNGMKAHVRRHIELGARFAAWIQGRPDRFALLTPPAFALTVFTIVPPTRTSAQLRRNHTSVDDAATEPSVTEGLATEPTISGQRDSDEANALTKEVYERINASGKLFLTSGVINGIYAIRVVSANEKANETSMRAAFDLIVDVAEQVCGGTTTTTTTSTTSNGVE